MLFPTTSNINNLNPSITIRYVKLQRLRLVICGSIFNVGMVGFRECARLWFYVSCFLHKIKCPNVGTHSLIYVFLQSLVEYFYTLSIGIIEMKMIKE